MKFSFSTLKLILIVFCLHLLNVSFGQDRTIKRIKEANESGDYSKSSKLISNYIEKEDTTNVNYLIALADFYFLSENEGFNPKKSFRIISTASCVQDRKVNSGIYFEDHAACLSVLTERRNGFASEWFHVVSESNNLDTLSSFLDDFVGYPEFERILQEKIVSVNYNRVKDSKSKEALERFLELFGESKFADQVRVLIEELDFETIKASQDLESFELFLEKYPQTKYTDLINSFKETIVYNEAIAENSLSTFDAFLKEFPFSNKIDAVNTKIERIRWDECVTGNLKRLYSNFIEEFPNSEYVQTAKSALDSLEVLVSSEFKYDLALSRSLPRWSASKQIMNVGSHLFVGMNDQSTYALARDNETETGTIVAAVDGSVLFDFPMTAEAVFAFSEKGNKLYFLDNSVLQVLDLETHEFKNLLQLPSEITDGIPGLDLAMSHIFEEDGIVHIGFRMPERFTLTESDMPNIIYHLSYNTVNGKENYEFLINPPVCPWRSGCYELEGWPASDQPWLNNKFDNLEGSFEQKIIKLKVLCGNGIRVHPTEKGDGEEYLILDWTCKDDYNPPMEYNRPMMIWKVGRDGMSYIGTVRLQKTDHFTGLVSDIDYWKSGRNSFWSSDNFDLCILQERELFHLSLFKDKEEDSLSAIELNHVDPRSFAQHQVGGRVGFVHLDNTSKKLYCQKEIPHFYPTVFGSAHRGYPLETSVQDFEPQKEQNSLALQDTMKRILNDLDSIGSLKYESFFPLEVLLSQPLETRKEKYYRLKHLFKDSTPLLSQLHDSLFSSLISLSNASRQTLIYDAKEVFDYNEYDLTNEAWRLVFTNRFNGSDFSFNYAQPRELAKKSISDEFSEMKIEVEYYFCPISMSFEPLVLFIQNNETSKRERFLIPFRDFSLRTHLSRTNAAYGFLSFACRHDVFLEDHILRNFVLSGRPKNYFDLLPEFSLYGFYSCAKVEIKNMDNPVANFNMAGFCGEDANKRVSKMFFDNVNQFVHATCSYESKDHEESSVFEIDNSSPFESDIAGSNPSHYNSTNYVIEIANLFDDFYDNYGTPLKWPRELQVVNKTGDVQALFDLFELGKKYYTHGQIYDLDDLPQFSHSFSPNGRYFTLRIQDDIHLYETNEWREVLCLQSASGEVYWDCNSFYLGIGDQLLPIPLLVD